jgi:hypothetical protein
MDGPRLAAVTKASLHLADADHPVRRAVRPAAPAGWRAGGGLVHPGFSLRAAAVDDCIPAIAGESPH